MLSCRHFSIFALCCCCRRRRLAEINAQILAMGGNVLLDGEGGDEDNAFRGRVAVGGGGRAAWCLWNQKPLGTPLARSSDGGTLLVLKIGVSFLSLLCNTTWQIDFVQDLVFCADSPTQDVRPSFGVWWRRIPRLYYHPLRG